MAVSQCPPVVAGVHGAWSLAVFTLRAITFLKVRSSLTRRVFTSPDGTTGSRAGGAWRCSRTRRCAGSWPGSHRFGK